MAEGTKKDNKQTLNTIERYLPWMLLILGAIAMLASIMLSIEVFDRLKNPNFQPICNLNPILSCTNVADSKQSELFGFPNYFIGIAGYAAVSAVGASILAGGKFKEWFWKLLWTGLLFAMLFIGWLQFETLYRIGSLCIFCMVVWAASIPIFWYTSLYCVGKGYIKWPKKYQGLISFILRHHIDIMVCWYLIIILLIIKRFWYYWSGLI